MCMNRLKEKAYSMIDQLIYDVDVELQNYENYIYAYCAELKVTECDILNNEELFEQTFNLFENVILIKKLNVA